ncbi:MAG: hypothetical protein ACP5VN_10450 [Acidobacteriota bacterium]
MHNEVLYRVTETYQSALSDLEVYGLYKDGLLLQAWQAYESSMASYAVGKVDFTTLLTALTNYYAYEGQAFRAKAGFQESIARMRAYLGSSWVQDPPSRTAGPGSQEGDK